MLHALLLVVSAACPPRTFCTTNGPPTTGVLLSAAVITSDDAWAVGENGVARHWDGKGWTTTSTNSSDRLHWVLALGPNDVWAVGNESVLHFDGAWHPVPLASPRRGSFGGVVQPRPGALWVLGPTPLQYEGGVLEPLTGAAATFGTGGYAIGAASCGPDDVWALVRGSPGVILHHWNGADVRVLRQPFNMQVGKIVCVDKVAWVATDDSVLSCTRQGCKAIKAPERPHLLDSTFGPVLLSGSSLQLWRKGAFQPIGQVDPETLGGAARSLDEVLLIGRHGSSEWFKGAASPARPSLRLPFLLGVAATADGHAWALSNHGLFSFFNERWSREDGFPARLDDRERLALWASSPSDVWVVADGNAWRFDGKTWKVMTPAGMKVKQVWGRGPDDVYLFGSSALRHWNGAKWEELAKLSLGLGGVAITGNATKAWALTTSGDDLELQKGELLVVEGGAVSRVPAPFWLKSLAFGGGELWGAGGSVARLTDKGWEPFGDVYATHVVPTQQGVLFLNGSATAREWNGQALTVVPLPGEAVAGASVGSTVWLVGDDTALRRTP